MGLNIAAALWGFAEATLFFIVPDVLLAWIALSSLRRALLACGWAVAGAVLGGGMMYGWGATRLESAEAVLARQPAVNQEMLTTVQRQVQTSGSKMLFAGPWAGRPYKIYAVYAGATRTNLAGFVLVSISARLLRFVAVSCLAAALARAVQAFLSIRYQRIFLCGCWIVFYAWFFGWSSF
ncbi:MAG: hypothetical protein VB876_15160 [Pirellulales bacterium]